MKINSILSTLTTFLGLTPPEIVPLWQIKVDGEPWGRLHLNYASFREAIVAGTKSGEIPKECIVTVHRTRGPKNSVSSSNPTDTDRARQLSVHMGGLRDGLEELFPSRPKHGSFFKPPRRYRSTKKYRVRRSRTRM